MVYKRQLFFQYSRPSGCDTSKLLSDDLKNELYYDGFQKMLYHYSHQSYFYPRPPRGGRLYPHGRCDPHDDISIHALREEGDRCLQRVPYPHRCISIHALREEGDDAYTAMKSSDKISIHALREEGDRLRIPLKAELSEYFYPRPPRGGRRPFT